MTAKLMVIGIGFKPLAEAAREAIASAEFVVSSRRLADVFTRYPEYHEARDRIRVIENIDETMQFIKECFDNGATTIVLIASGDPLFFGIGRRAVREFGLETVEVLPDLSSLQTAFARIKEAWDDALFMSLHGGPDPDKRKRLKYEMTDLPGLLENYKTIGVLTDRENNPAAIAGFLARNLPPDRSPTLYVGEKMGYEDERITVGCADEIARIFFSEPSVLIIKNQQFNTQHSTLNTPSPLPRFGLREEEIGHSRGLITKDEVRAVALHALRLPESGVFWDIGAGSGAVAIEAARLCPGLDVFAVEKDEEQHALATQNKAAYNVRNLTVLVGEAPDALSALPDPVRVFIGGSGGKLGGIIAVLNGRMHNGIVVVNAATLETLNEAVHYLEKAGFAVSISEISVARSKPVGGRRYLAALNPVFVIMGEKNSGYERMA